ncbi:pentatricopeptide repeat-containing protein At3g12770-like isoform X2 [Telopea speciosissima]|uniref:pentatricopeptide repeat-containing protein At3g12770-like isoform X2 n=1 Tax=Telopea speciosissima TaxID=54955 RepID=UPI001CC73C5B|nr:pentatricopeptide repeat-containing protein At3g12770-like isoform X2 [Telopea speciosissima]
MSGPQASHRRPEFSQIFNSLAGLLHHSLQTRNLRTTKAIHAHLLRVGLIFNSFSLHTSLILTYSTCLHRDHLQLQNLNNFLSSLNPTEPLPFNAIVSAFSRSGFSYLALRTFSFMHATGVPLDTYALCSSLRSSSSIRALAPGRQMHAHVSKSGWSSSVYVGTALVDLYSKSSLIGDASKLFDEIPMKNTVCANALLSGYAEAKLWGDGLELVRSMSSSLRLGYDRFTLCELLRICTGLLAIELGRQVHANMIRKIADVESDVFLQSSLVEMYGKCGIIDKARHVFDLAGMGREGGMERTRDVVLWTSMLSAYGRHGRFEEVIRLFQDMLMAGMKPDGVAFLAVISACAHTGQVSLGLEYFESMTPEFGSDPGPEHYGSVVDLLCRAGEVDKAWNLITGMPLKENLGSSSSSCTGRSVSVWGALLSACNENGNVELGKLAAQRALELDPENVGIYVLLSNMYARFGMWDEIGKLRKLMKEKGLKKDVGCSWVEVSGDSG